MTPTKESPNLMIEGATLLFRNFTGAEKDFNSEGDRNFCVVIEPELAEKLKAERWRIKQLKAREEGEPGDYYMQVKVNYKTGRPPRCVLITSGNRTELGADEVGMFDVADMGNVDLIINGYWSDMSGGGYSCYLKTIFVTINEDELEKKYNEQHQKPGDEE